ncbi:MAG: hypothetical protein KDC33_06290 [Thermoleophilia bacterium]|nr:hypothetical protein [Thermoleophilia bacterium]
MTRRTLFVGVPTTEDVQVHCQRVRAAGSPNARARAALVTEYRRLAEALGVSPEIIETGLDLQRASAALLRSAAHAEVAAARSPRRYR